MIQDRVLIMIQDRVLIQAIVIGDTRISESQSWKGS